MKAFRFFLMLIVLISVVIMSFSPKKIDILKLSFVEIPAGTLNLKEKISMNSFLISAYEITNGQYNEFLADLKKNNRMDELKIAQIDTFNWKSDDVYYEIFSDYYHCHPAYANYPVLNISYQGALLYCKWLTEKSTDKTVEYRLPTKNEWMYAAKGGMDLNPYAWGGPFCKTKRVNLCVITDA